MYRVIVGPDRVFVVNVVTEWAHLVCVTIGLCLSLFGLRTLGLRTLLAAFLIVHGRLLRRFCLRFLRRRSLWGLFCCRW